MVYSVQADSNLRIIVILQKADVVFHPYIELPEACEGKLRANVFYDLANSTFLQYGFV